MRRGGMNELWRGRVIIFEGYKQEMGWGEMFMGCGDWGVECGNGL